MINLSILQGCNNYGHFICYVHNCFFLLNGMYIAIASPSIRKVICIVRSLTFPSLYGLFLFIVFNIIIRHVSAFWCCNVLMCFTFKISSLILILREIPRIISKYFIRLKTFSFPSKLLVFLLF